MHAPSQIMLEDITMSSLVWLVGQQAGSSQACLLLGRIPEHIWTDPCDLNRQHLCSGFSERVQGESY